MNILLTSAGRRDYLVRYLKSELSTEDFVFVSNSESKVSSFLEADKHFISPDVLNLEYPDFIYELCLKYEIHVIFPLIDLDVVVLSKHKNRFQAIGVTLFTPEFEIANLCFDKMQMHNWLSCNGYKSPKMFGVYGISRNFKGIEGVQFPAIIKPRYGWGSTHTYVVENQNELKSGLEFAYSRRSQLKLRYLGLIDGELNEMLVQELVHGDELAINILSDLDGSGLHATSILKHKMRAGETEFASITNYDDMEFDLIRLANSLKLIGITDIDLIKRGGDLFVIDVNTRIGGSYPFVHALGVNYLGWLVRALSRSENNPIEFSIKRKFDSAVKVLDIKAL